MTVFKKLHEINCLIRKKFPFLKYSNRECEQIGMAIEAREKEHLSLFKENQDEHYTVQIHIDKPKEQAFYLSIKNKSSYESALDQLALEIDQLKNRLQKHLDSNKQVPDDIQKSVNHLMKYLDMFQRRLETHKKINDSTFISSIDYREAAREKLSELFSSSFIFKCMQAIADGCRLESKKQYYINIAKIFNSFLSRQGIYTKLFSINDEIDFQLLIPESKKTTDNLELSGRIADIYMLPYFFNDPNYDGHALISEGVCIAYSIQ